jgi:hypothetical protein
MSLASLMMVFDVYATSGPTYLGLCDIFKDYIHISKSQVGDILELAGEILAQYGDFLMLEDREELRLNPEARCYKYGNVRITALTDSSFYRTTMPHHQAAGVGQMNFGKYDLKQHGTVTCPCLTVLLTTDIIGNIIHRAGPARGAFSDNSLCRAVTDSICWTNPSV